MTNSAVYVMLKVADEVVSGALTVKRKLVLSEASKGLAIVSGTSTVMPGNLERGAMACRENPPIGASVVPAVVVKMLVLGIVTRRARDDILVTLNFRIRAPSGMLS